MNMKTEVVSVLLGRRLMKLFAGLSLLVSASAHATLMIEIDDLGNGAGVDATLVDEGAGDMFLGAPGMLRVNAMVGGSSFFIGAGSGAPNVGELFDINMLTTLAADSSWVIRIVDSMFMLGDAAGQRATSWVTPTTVNSVHTITVETRVDGQTVLASTPLASFVNQADTALVDISQPTTIEHIIRITAGNNGMMFNTSTFDTRTVVPEPGILGLVGVTLIGLALRGRRKASKA